MKHEYLGKSTVLLLILIDIAKFELCNKNTNGKKNNEVTSSKQW